MEECRHKIRRLMTEALATYEMISEGDRVLAAVSGGKDSSVMLMLLEDIRKRAPISFKLEAVIVDQKQPGFDMRAFGDWVATLDIKLHVVEENTYSIVVDKTPKGKTYCGLCSRLRRGILYNFASENGFDKIALGHHREDLNETLLLNLFYSGSIASMPPKLISDDQRNTVIRPMALVAEKQITNFAASLNIPIIPCNLCGSQENLKRQEIKRLLHQLEKDNPHLPNSLLASQANIKTSQLADTRFLST